MKKKMIEMLLKFFSVQADLMMIIGALSFIVSAMCWGILDAAPVQWVQDLGVAGGAVFGIGTLMQVVLLSFRVKREGIL